ncbi:TonB-dependent receptor plug domain-containing protein [Muriicola marianensis]|uniref:TonB-dependent receptor plug domain-containing protein n=1 Tax=Muriicola marianensis TaxID=1324801 RepID=A0ABQ1QT74_9FLAO|nr:TonB-dependent receptor plug domain-containing protein [Muriicola marianensis]GGD41736.1 hypothetical protein GCM10011361_06010 [Muriicola marianensis]
MKYLHLSFSFALILLTSLSGLRAQGTSSPFDLTKSASRSYIDAGAVQMMADSLWLWQEQVSLQTDREELRAGETLFFKANILTGPEKFRVSASEVLRVELLDQSGNLIKKQVHRITNGRSAGSIEVPVKMESGIYFLRAYTRWMLNYGLHFLPAREILIKDRRDNDPVLLPEQEVSIQPEGGQLVDGLMTQVVVSSRNHELNRIPVLNQKGEVVAKVEEYGRKLGSFRLTPQAGQQYSIRLPDNRLLPLPEVMENGYSLQVNNLQPEKILIRIEVTESLLQKPVYLKGRYDQVTYVDKNIEFEGGNVASFEISRAEIPDGLLDLYIADEEGQIWAHRPVLIEKNELRVNAQKQINEDGSESILLRVTDRDQNPVSTTLSVSVNGDDSSETAGFSTVESIEKREQERNTAFLKDLRVLTGKHTNLTNILPRMRVPDRIVFDFQKGLDFIGQAYNLNNELLVNSEMQILIENGDQVTVQEVVTDQDGMFTLSGLDILGDATLVFRTAGDESAAKLVKVIPFEYETPLLASPEGRRKGLQKMANTDSPGSGQLLSAQSTREEKERTISLESVTVVATRELSKSKIPEFALMATKAIEQDPERPRPIDQLFLNIPGVQVVGLGSPYPYLSIPRAARLGPLLWILDGFLLDQSTTLVDIMNLVPFTDVERIEILMGGEASFYGTRSAGGVISIKTRSGSDLDYLARKDAQAPLQGYHESIAFDELGTDTRVRRKRNASITTIFWGPELRTDKNGEVVIPVPESTALDQIRLEATVFTQDGKQGSIEVFFDKID